MLSRLDIELIDRNRMTILEFCNLPEDEQESLLKKWRKKDGPVLTVRDVSPLHNDGDRRMVAGRDF